MYNAEQKTRFVKDFTVSENMRAVALSVFNSFEPYEEAWHADLCTRSAGDIAEVLNHFRWRSVQSSNAPLYILRSYAKWCMEHKVPGACDGVLKADYDRTAALKRSTVKNPRHLAVYLDAVFIPEASKTVELIFRGFFWLAYAGMDIDDIFLVRKEHMDFERMFVRFNDTEYPIYPQGLNALRLCTDLSHFEYNAYAYSVSRPRAEGDYIMRSFAASVPDRKKTMTRLSKFTRRACESGKTEMRLNYGDVWNSGVFYRKLEAELAGEPVSFDAELDRIYGDRDSENKSKRRIAFFTDYNRWKQTLLT